MLPQIATYLCALSMTLSETRGRKHLLMPFTIKQKKKKTLNISRYHLCAFGGNCLQHHRLNLKLLLRYDSCVRRKMPRQALRHFTVHILKIQRKPAGRAASPALCMAHSAPRGSQRCGLCPGAPQLNLTLILGGGAGLAHTQKTSLRQMTL